MYQWRSIGDTQRIYPGMFRAMSPGNFMGLFFEIFSEISFKNPKDISITNSLVNSEETSVKILDKLMKTSLNKL